MDWQPKTGKRKRGIDREEDGEMASGYYAGTTWTRTAKNRNEWHLHEEGYILH